MKVNELMAQRNAIEAKISAIEAEIRNENDLLLIEEVANLLDGVGPGFVSEDDYASDRYFSRIPGVKNVRRYGEAAVLVKVTSPAGELLPETLPLRGREVKVFICRSRNYSGEVDY